MEGGLRLLGDSERAVVVRRAVDSASTGAARYPGFADALGRALAELDGALLAPDDLDEPLGSYARAYGEELDRLGALGPRTVATSGGGAPDERDRVVG